MLPNAQKGIEFLFKPDFTKITGDVFLGALGQSFYSMESKAWRYLEERIEWHTNQGHVQMSVSFDYNPQTALHMLRELGYGVAPQTIDKEAHYYSFIITWFERK